MMRGAKKTWKQQEEEEKKQRESGQLHPSKSGLGHVKYPRRLTSTSTKTVSSIDEAERARRRNLAYEAALSRIREAEKEKSKRRFYYEKFMQ